MSVRIPVLLLVLFLVPVICLSLSAAGSADSQSLTGDLPALVLIGVEGPLEDLALPLYADLVDASGREYILTIMEPSALVQQKLLFRILDPDASGRRYIIARERRAGARLEAGRTLEVLHDDGLRIVLRESPGLDTVLGLLGFDLQLIGAEPLKLASRRSDIVSRAVPDIAPDPVVSSMLEQLSEAAFSSSISGLSGVAPVTVGGAAYTITTRYTNSGAPLEKATQYAYEHFQGLGLAASYQNWSYGSLSARNVIGERRGTGTPQEVVLITAHLDDMPPSGAAPGADDNASGAAAVLLAAEVMSRYQFDRTLRYVLFTGEEQGLLGSDFYAASVSGQNIAAVINADMISYNTAATAPIFNLHTRTAKNPGYASDLLIATAFADLVSTYSLPLNAVIVSDGEPSSDHASFWYQGYPAILAIEDDYNDFNPGYHTAADLLQYLDLSYTAAAGKAVMGTAAVLADTAAPAGSFTLLVTRQGEGAITTAPPGLHNFGSVTAGSAFYPAGGVVSLTAVPAAPGYVLTGLSGDAGCSTASVTMSAARACHALFSPCAVPPARIGADSYATLDGAYTSVRAETEFVLELVAYKHLLGTYDFSADKNITLRGGLDCGYNQQAYMLTLLSGAVAISRGSVVFDRILIQ